MFPRLKVPAHAKIAAKKALTLRTKLPESKKFGITKAQASQLHIASGVERAKQLIKNTSIPFADAIRVARFYQRFKNRHTTRAQGAIDLWGGRKFGMQALAFVRKNKK